MLAEANYGGRITDNNDRKLINVYCKELFNDELIAIEKWRPANTQEYNYQYTIDEANVKSPEQSAFFTPDFFLQDIMQYMHEGNDPPAAFGQHANAEIGSQITETNDLLEAIVRLQPLQVAGGGVSKEALLLAKVDSVEIATSQCGLRLL